MKRFLVVAMKDLRAELRTKQMLNCMLIFSLLVLIIFNFAFGQFPERMDELAPGLLWVAFVFAGTLGLSRSFASELEQGCLEGLKLCPVDRGAIYAGKVISNALIMFMVEAVTIPLFMVLFDYQPKGLLPLLLVVFLGTLGFVIVGTILSALTVNTRTRELLLPVVLFPVLVPVIISAVLATGRLLVFGDIWRIISELRILAVYDTVFFIVALFIFDFVIED